MYALYHILASYDQKTLKSNRVSKFIFFTVACFLKDHVGQDNWGEERLEQLHG